MNSYDKHQLTARELDRAYVEPCPPLLALFLSLCAGFAGILVLWLILALHFI